MIGAMTGIAIRDGFGSLKRPCPDVDDFSCGQFILAACYAPSSRWQYAGNILWR
jgi:hypothetical protein